MGWVFGNTFVRVDRFSGTTSGLIRVRVLGSTFGRIFGVEIELSRRFTLTCIPLPALRGRL
jgi:hypothetical protein